MRGCRAELTVEVVLNMLEQRPPPASGGHGHRPPKRCGDSERNGSGISEKDAEDAYFHQAVTGMLLENIESVPYLRSRLRADPSLFSDVPCEAIVPQILEYLAARYCGKGKSGPSAGSTSLSGLLCKMMKSSTDAGRSDDFIGYVVASLHDIDNRKGSSEKMPSVVEHNKTTMTSAFSRKNGPLWRLELLGESPSSSSLDAAYREILVAVAKSMVDMPSSSTPLALLSSLVDGQFCSWHAPPGDDAPASDRYEKRIVLATSGILRYAVREISLSRRNDIVDGETIFGRLAPLLVLRCIPRSYYAALHKALPSDKDVHSVMADLSAFLSKTLQAHATKRDESNLAKEEKKLLAELAGHTLPFSSRKLNVPCRYPAALSGNDSPVSLFENICMEPFSCTLNALGVNNTDGLQLRNVYESKAALYAVSHYVQIASDEDDGESLLDVASFVFEVLNYHVSGTALKDPFAKETVLLQSGCVQFLAIIMGSLSKRKTKTIRPAKPTPLIEDLNCPLDSDESHARKIDACTSLEALSQIFRILKTIIISGRILRETLYHGFSSFPGHNIEERSDPIQFSPSSRTAMLNSIVMLSQGSRERNSKLDWLASNILPTLVEWAPKGSLDENACHPLCIAAALQAIYSLLARCGSFGWLSSRSDTGPNNVSETDFVCRTLNCALKLFHTSEGASPDAHILRLAALKVILTVIALNQSNEAEQEKSLTGFLSPVEIRRAMPALQGAANVDQNPEVRRIANEIIPYLH